MGCETGRFMEKLLKVLEISNAQKKLFEENRMEELSALQLERERIFIELKALEGETPPRETLRPAVKEIEENDTLLRMNIEGALSGIKGRLEKIKNGTKAVKAYTAR
ncbi:MAG: hypothetical protein HZB22_07220 [Deltaproteobacteria bacterium]|nr:hypothetical protein [Deltaproteobacteria bacterium]